VGSKVLLQTPTYNGFYGDLRASQTLAEEVPLKVVNGQYAMDFEQFEKQISVDTNSFILCNPQNPTGNCWSAANLTRIGEICLKHRVVVLADEIHCDFVAKGQKYTPFASLPNKDIVNNSITFKAASKSFGLAAHKTAWFYSTNADFLERIKVHHRAELNTLGIVANMGAYTPEGEEWLSQVVDYIDGNSTFAVQFIGEKMPMVKAYKPQGTYLMWLDMTALAEKIGTKAMAADYNRTKAAGAAELSPEQMLERHLIKTAKVHLNAGTSYGLGGANHMRMNVATSRRTLELALNNLAGALDKSSSM
jgi:cystathionine beta-lyase